MEAMVVLILISLVVAVGFLFLFLKNVKEGEYDDLTSPSVRMLNDDKAVDSDIHS